MLYIWILYVPVYRVFHVLIYRVFHVPLYRFQFMFEKRSIVEHTTKINNISSDFWDAVCRLSIAEIYNISQLIDLNLLQQK